MSSLSQEDMIERARGVGHTPFEEQSRPHDEEHRAWLKTIGRESMLDYVERVEVRQAMARLDDRREGMREYVGEEL